MASFALQIRTSALDFDNLQNDWTIEDVFVQKLVESGMSLDEINLSNALHEALMLAAGRMANGEQMSWKDVHQLVGEIGDRHGCEYGVPIPTPDYDHGGVHDVVMARRTPLRLLTHTRQYQTEMAETLSIQLNMATRNSWERCGDTSYAILNTEDGPIIYSEPMAGNRLRKFMATYSVRNDASHLTVEAEMKAMESLKGKISNGQYRSYVLNGAFNERSKRSNIYYVFRKGYPTIALSFSGSKTGRVLCCLCLHPFGYYRGTWAGMMTPTDEVIAALLMMRGNEPKFWARSGQWPAYDPRSGL